MDKYDVKSLDLAEGGRRRIEWAEREMPVLRSIRERFERERPFEGIRMSACLHVTTETANLMRTLQAGGADVVLTASNPLSTQDDVVAALAAQGIGACAWHGATPEEYNQHLETALTVNPHLIIDDGGDLTALLHTSYKAQGENLLGGTEETTTGLRRLRALEREGQLLYPATTGTELASRSGMP